MAVATEQEMKAKAQQARAEVIQAEAEVPKALAQALREGNMGFMDYYKLENLKGDTAMRDTIAKLDPTAILGGKRRASNVGNPLAKFLVDELTS